MSEMQEKVELKEELVQKPSKYQLVTRKMEPMLMGISNAVRRAMIGVGEKANIRRKKSLIAKVNLSELQKNEINAFYKKHYGKKVPFHWHRLYQSYTGTYHYDYFPEVLWSTKLEPLLNPYREADFLGDKNLLEPLFGAVEGVRIPKTYLSCVKGFFRSADMEMLDRKGGEEALQNIGRCVIKKTVETSSGRDVALCDIQNGVDKKSGFCVSELLSLFGNNFIVQELIEQFAPLATLNKSSLNTFRVMTYLLDGAVYHCPPALRLGRSGAEKDNIHYGGICVGVTETGRLRKYAFSEQGEAFEEHPDSHITLLDYEIPGFDRLIDVAHRLHARVPYLGLVSWDLSLDKNGIPVLIEMNTMRQSAWFCQMVNGEPLFGENTSKILEIIR